MNTWFLVTDIMPIYKFLEHPSYGGNVRISPRTIGESWKRRARNKGGTTRLAISPKHSIGVGATPARAPQRRRRLSYPRTHSHRTAASSKESQVYAFPLSTSSRSWRDNDSTWAVCVWYFFRSPATDSLLLVIRLLLLWSEEAAEIMWRRHVDPRSYVVLCYGCVVTFWVMVRWYTMMVEKVEGFLMYRKPVYRIFQYLET